MIPISYYAMPHAIFSSPQVAGVGFTEQELAKKQQKNNSKNNTRSIIDYRKSVYHYIDTAMGLAIKDHDGFVKFLIGKKLLYRTDKPYRSSTKLPGISISNFFHKYRNSTNGWRFGYVKFKDASEVKWYFDKLGEYEPPLIKPISDIEWIKREQLQKKLSWPIEDETRYGIVDKQVHEFLLYCIALLGETESLMEHIWKYKRKPDPEEVEWHRFLYGIYFSNNFFMEINKKRSELKRSKQNNAAIAATDKRIKSMKAISYKNYQMLYEEKYKDIHANYGIITCSLMQIAYPDFIRKK